ncbi:MAG: SUMF1/EgtB/PvdO family nonheme iron enzyme [Myxococcota bacterium]
MREWTPPRELEEYSLLRPLGRGAMGQVYLAQDNLLDRAVAVKFIASLRTGSEIRRRFLIEARAAARLQHPNVVSVYRVGELEARPFLVSEFVEGQTLDKLPKPLPSARVQEIAIGLARGLAAAHRRGVLHRDLKPANAIVTEDGTPKILDFGLAKMLDSAEPELPRGSLDLPASAEAIDLRARTAGVEALRASTLQPSAIDARASTPRPGALLAAEAREVRRRSATRAGALMGTPDYMAPEVWRGEPASAASDVWSLGALLYELASGHAPFAAVDLGELRERINQQEPPPLLREAPKADPRLAAIIDKALAREVSARYPSAEELRAALEELARDTRGSAPIDKPYRGLRPFEEAHAAAFRGREREVDAVVDRLRSDAIVIVTGEAGAGKTSLVRAGLIPQITARGLGDARKFQAQTLSSTPGRNLESALLMAIAAQLGTEEAELSSADPRKIAELLKSALGTARGWLLVIDPLDGAALDALGGRSERFEDLILRGLSLVPGVRIVMTARTETLGRLAALPRLGELTSRALYVLRPPSLDAFRRMIREPAELAGARFEREEMIEALAVETHALRGGLVLLELVLAELWEARDPERNIIRTQDLEALGGVRGAIRAYADAAYESLPVAERAPARRILVALVSDDGQRLERGADEVCGDSQALLQTLGRLVETRLVLAQATEGGFSYALAHDALVTDWPLLRDWLDEDVDLRRLEERIGRAAAEWDALGRQQSGLWSRQQLASVAAIDLRTLAPRARDFIQASQRTLSRARRRRIAAALAVPALLGTTYGVFAWRQQVELDRAIQAREARAQALEANAQAALNQANADYRTAAEAFDRADEGAAEPAYQRYLQGAAEAGRLLRDATTTHETALLLAPERALTKAALAEVLYGRAILADRLRQTSTEEELLDRLALHDQDGHLRARFEAPAEVHLKLSRDVDPTVEIERFVPSPDGHLRPERLGAFPASALPPLAPGSIRLRLHRERQEILLPLLLHRGEHLDLELNVPRSIPLGFVWIPAGRFIYGSTAEESARRSFYEAQPAHERRLHGFFIAKQEVTYGEWISFLEALSPADRQQHMPGASGQGAINGKQRLERTAEGSYRLILQPSGAAEHRARLGQPMIFEARKERRVTRWERFPVTAVSAEDAEAYTAWLRGTQRLAGARICSEVEWERAARGADAREYPHGSTLLPSDADFDRTYDKEDEAMGPDEVGSFPASRSPFGVDDLAGNAYEWTTSASAPGKYIARGGSFFYDATTARLSNRTAIDRTARDVSLGVRLCITEEDQ